MSPLDQVLNNIDADLDNSLERLFAWLRISSISTDPAYAAHCRAAAEWLRGDLAALGFDASKPSAARSPCSHSAAARQCAA